MKKLFLIMIALLLISSCKKEKKDNTALLLGAAAIASQPQTVAAQEQATVRVKGVAKDSSGTIIANGQVLATIQSAVRNTVTTPFNFWILVFRFCYSKCC